MLIISTLGTQAHNPPSCGNTDCGTIQGSTFYSVYYSPGNPNGTPVSAGGGVWTKTSYTPCDTYRYQNVNYTFYPHKFICSTPIDTDGYWMMAGIGLVGFIELRKRD